MSLALVDVTTLRNAKSLNLEQVLSSLIHGALLSRGSNDALEKLCRDYEHDMDLQAEIEWPNIVVRNDIIRGLFEIHKFRSQFVQSSNPLTLVHKILYVEYYKANCYEYRKYPKISEKIIVPDASLCDYTLSDLVRHAKSAISQYMRSYEKGSIEYQLGSDALQAL